MPGIFDDLGDLTDEQREQARATRRRLLGTYLLLIAAIAALLVIYVVSARADIFVVDGDTIVVDREIIRIVGMDAPETRRARCKAERTAGYRSKLRLARLLTAACGPLESANARRCLDIDRLPKPDRYGRTLARIAIDGKDVAATMIARGLARPYDCPRGRCPARAGWCGG